MALQQWPFRRNPAIGGNVAFILGVYDDASGTITNVRYRNSSAALGDFNSGGRLEFTLSGGVVTMTVHTAGMSDASGLFFEFDVQLNGSGTWLSVDAGANDLGGLLNCYMANTETISIGSGSTFTMTADLPSAGKTKLVVNFTDATSVLDGTASNFKINAPNTTYGGVFLNGPGKCLRMGTSTLPAVKHLNVGDSRLSVTGGVTYDTCGRAAHFENNDTNGALIFQSNVILANTVVPAVADNTASDAQIYLKGVGIGQVPTADGTRWPVGIPGSPDYRSQITNNVCRKAWWTFDTAANHAVVTGNVLLGDRCGMVNSNIGSPVKFDGNYVDTRQNGDSQTGNWSQVAGFQVDTGTYPNITNNIFRTAEWQLRGYKGSTADSNVFAEGQSHNFIDGAGGATTIVTNNIFLQGNLGTNPSPDGVRAIIEVQGSGFTVQHNTCANANHYTTLPFVVVNSGITCDAVKDNIVTGLRVNRGNTVTGNCAIAPEDGANITGSPPRPAVDANRMTAADHNLFFDNASGGTDSADTYAEYGIGTDTGSPGTGDVSSDPLFVSGTYTFPSDANIINGTATITQMLSDIRAAFTLKAGSPARNAASDGTHIGAVQLAAPAASGSPASALALLGVQ